MVIAAAPCRGGHVAQRGRLALGAVVVLAAIGVALPGCGGGPGGSAVQGSGIAATQARAVARFSSVDLAGGNVVAVVAGGQQSVVVHADSNLIGHIRTRVVAGTLVIDDIGSYTSKSPMSVQVSVPSLAAVKLSGDGMITVSGIKAHRLTVTLPGDGVIHASGTAVQLDVTVGGDGQAQLTGLIARHVHAVVTGSGLIQVTATTSLDGAVPGDGAILYSGNPPHVATSVTGSGTVTPG
jgi:Putative auto-transporter adhesin, head GIN domain